MRFLLLNQTFYPDVAATAQYLSELAQALVEQGHSVTVVASRRAYDNPEKLFLKHELWRGVRIVRVGSTGFGKSAKWRRAADFASFIGSCSLRLLFLPRPDVIIALTSPPLISFIGAVVAGLRRSQFCYWVMDFNPDEAIAAGWLRPGSAAARVLDSLSRFSLRRANTIIALDRFMRDRIQAKGIAPEKIAVLPPWSLDSEIHFDAAGREQFRRAHGLEDKFVVMYSGNHSPCHPLDTLIDAARALADDPAIVFCFVGGGSEFRRIQKLVADDAVQAGAAGLRRLRGVRCLPYQPLNQLAGSLSAADLHVVVMGDPFVGLVHPCKAYNILNVGAPMLYVGPRPSHVTEVLERLPAEFPRAVAAHGDVAAVVSAIHRIRALGTPARPPVPPEVQAQVARNSVLPRMLSLLTASKS